MDKNNNNCFKSALDTGLNEQLETSWKSKQRQYETTQYSDLYFLQQKKSEQPKVVTVVDVSRSWPSWKIRKLKHHRKKTEFSLLPFWRNTLPSITDSNSYTGIFQTPFAPPLSETLSHLQVAQHNNKYAHVTSMWKGKFIFSFHLLKATRRQRAAADYNILYNSARPPFYCCVSLFACYVLCTTASPPSPYTHHKIYLRDNRETPRIPVSSCGNKTRALYTELSLFGLQRTAFARFPI